MYLKSIELLGFKSFAQKTVLDFHRGVTAIVGPNGCGKSNVLDALRWVLGEQSAKALRGGEMSDVIFNGTDSRPALGMAEVSLTFAECEKDLGVQWNEVRITRRVFKDGGSEYLLNKTPCRLKDIHNLFMDTGIGRSAYSIMEQGKIDLILSSRPEDRRAIFEEAAGITKYKSQKKEALRKLEYTESNLVRITDIVKEVKRQIGSLQRQAGKARRYQSLLGDVRTLDLHWSRHQLDQFDTQLAEAIAEIQRVGSLLVSREDQIQGHEESLAVRRGEAAEIEARIAEARQALQELRSGIQTATSRIDFNGERITESDVLRERYQLDIATSEEKAKVQETQIHETDTQLEELLRTLDMEQAQLDAETERTNAARTERTTAERTLQELNSRITSLEGLLAKLRGELSNAVQQSEGGQTRLGLLDTDIRQFTENHARLELQTTETRTRISETRTGLDARREEFRLAEASQGDCQRAVQQAGNTLAAAQRTLAERESKLEVLKQLNEEGEGFNEGAKAVLRGLDNPDFFKPAMLGALATLIDVAPDSIPAIEAALGQNLQAVVVKDASIAEAAILTLSSKRLGRAALAVRDFLPSPRTVQIESLPDGGIAWAIDRVKAPEELAPLVARLLDSVLLVPDLETAFRLRASHPGITFATAKGETLSTEGILLGGQAGVAVSSVLQRRHQISALETEASAARESVATSEATLANCRTQLEEQQRAVATLRDEVQAAQVAVSTIEGQLSMLDREFRETTGRLESLQWENRTVRENLDASQLRTKELEASIGKNEQELNDGQHRRTELLQRTEVLRASEAELAESLNNLRMRVAVGRQSRENLTRQRQPLAARLVELAELIQQRHRDVANCETRATTLRTESESLRIHIEEQTAQATTADADITQIATQRQEALHAINEIDQVLRGARHEISELHDLRSKQEVRQAQFQLKIDNLLEHANRRYQSDLRTVALDGYALHCSIREQRKRRQRHGLEETSETAPDAAAEVEAVADSSEQIDWELVQSMVAELTERLDAMGPVNLEAIQEFDELEQRHRFLEEQYADLTKSKAELLDVISKINSITRELFAETFEKVRVNFQEMFTELFGGGKANLLLADESDPLESGIEIIARPPGKQLQSITLLSGGEKTMTAVALLFSIYMVKPSPFCVLDEMDAPLDESNINRFIKILDRFVGQSQFVVITHNKRTIARADVLYGVTMEEHGVSKPVGVKLTKREDAGTRTDMMGENVPSVAESFGKHGNLHSETEVQPVPTP